MGELVLYCNSLAELEAHISRLIGRFGYAITDYIAYAIVPYETVTELKQSMKKIRDNPLEIPIGPVTVSICGREIELRYKRDRYFNGGEDGNE
jgi:hypothetical protein